MKRGRIGVAFRVHGIKKFKKIGKREYWGVAICRKWAGLLVFTKESITCWDCRRKI